ncbi:MAG: hypothetical protein F4Y86_05730 [Gammaproteobacteria bacterium]|nr:hypothetical protein [Gammaproteobacteria bacterium]MYB36215.1 hypothetical protein [Gammaproteobacteria bacterium]
MLLALSPLTAISTATSLMAVDFLVAQIKAPDDRKYAWLQVPARDRNTLAAASRERSLRGATTRPRSIRAFPQRLLIETAG